MKKIRDEDKPSYVISIHEPVDQRQHPVWKLFDRPIAFHRGFVTLTGSVTAALMLSQAVYWSRRSTNPAGWFYKTADDWEEETGLTRREQETARKRLRHFNWWQEELHKADGVPTLHFRVDAASFAQSVETDFHKLVKPDSTNDEIPTVSTNCENPINIDYTETTNRERESAESLPVLRTLPGVPKPRPRKAKLDADRVAHERDALGLSARELTALTDKVLGRMNALELANSDTDYGDDEFSQAQQATLALARLGHKTSAAIDRLWDSWKLEDWRGKKGEAPTYKSIVEFAKTVGTNHRPQQASAAQLVVQRMEGEE